MKRSAICVLAVRARMSSRSPGVGSTGNGLGYPAVHVQVQPPAYDAPARRAAQACGNRVCERELEDRCLARSCGTVSSRCISSASLLGLYHGRLEEIDATWTSIVSILASFWRTACRRKTPPAEQNWCSAGCGRSCCLQNHSFGSKAALHGQHKIGLLRR